MTSVVRALTLAVSTLIATACTTSSLPAAIINFVDAPPGGSGSDFRIESISDLEVNGNTYDVRFHHGVSFDSLSTGITFANPVAAVSALNAVVDYVNSEAIDASAATSQTNGIVVPFSVAGPVVQSVAEVNVGLNPLTYSDFDIFPFQLSSSPLAADTAYATFAAVPEPNAFLLGWLALVSGCGCCRRPRRRRT